MAPSKVDGQLDNLHWRMECGKWERLPWGQAKEEGWERGERAHGSSDARWSRLGRMEAKGWVQRFMRERVESRLLRYRGPTTYRVAVDHVSAPFSIRCLPALHTPPHAQHLMAPRSVSVTSEIAQRNNPFLLSSLAVFAMLPAKSRDASHPDGFAFPFFAFFSFWSDSPMQPCRTPK